MVKDCSSCYYADVPQGTSLYSKTCLGCYNVYTNEYDHYAMVSEVFWGEKPMSEESKAKPLDVQVGGDHYKKLKIQPVEYIHANNLGYLEGNVVKYISRWRDKGGKADLEKVKHYVDLLIQLENPK